MEIHLDHSDDLSIIQSLQEQARVLRRRGSAKSAHTASKVELMFSKAIEEISASQGKTATEEQK